MKQWSEIIRNVTMLSQLGLSLITPTRLNGLQFQSLCQLSLCLI